VPHDTRKERVFTQSGATKLLEPKVVIPIHYDTFDVIKQDPLAFAARVEAETPSECVVLRPGDSYRL
jgi:L-ascorbate metabolism protein UlaG (beta-lactamase superfamily)